MTYAHPDNQLGLIRAKPFTDTNKTFKETYPHPDNQLGLRQAQALTDTNKTFTT